MAAAAGLVLIPGAPLQTIILGVQVLAGVMLPSAIVFLQLLLNDRAMLGERFANRRWNNWVNWTVIAAAVRPLAGARRAGDCAYPVLRRHLITGETICPTPHSPPTCSA